MRSAADRRNSLNEIQIENGQIFAESPWDIAVGRGFVSWGLGVDASFRVRAVVAARAGELVGVRRLSHHARPWRAGRSVQEQIRLDPRPRRARDHRRYLQF